MLMKTLGGLHIHKVLSVIPVIILSVKWVQEVLYHLYFITITFSISVLPCLTTFAWAYSLPESARTLNLAVMKTPLMAILHLWSKI